MSAARLRLGLGAALALAAAMPLHGAGRKARAVPPASLPAWLREAASRTPAAAGNVDCVWLHDESLIEPLAEGGVRVTRRAAARVSSEPGLHVAGTRTVGYRKQDEVLSLRAWTVRGDAARESGADDVTDGPWLAASELFADTRVRTVTAPGLQVGAVVGYEESVLRKLDAGLEAYTFGDPDRPTAWSRVTLKVPAGWGLAAVRQRFPAAIASEESGESLSFSARDLAPLPREEDPPPPADVLPRVWLRWWSPDGSRGFRDWDAVGRWYEELSAAPLAETGEARALGERLRPAAPPVFLDALERAFAFVARDVRYVAVEIGIGGYRPHSPAETCRNRYGDCKDKAFLLRALTQSWGVKSYPVLVRVRPAGRVEPEAPSPAQFNHAIAGVVLPEGVGSDRWAVVEVAGLGRLALLDATARDGSSGDLPAADQGTLGLVVHPGGGQLVSLPVQPPAAALATRTLTAAVDDQGQIRSATLVQAWTGGLAAATRGRLAELSREERRKAAARWIGERIPGARLREHRLDGVEAGTVAGDAGATDAPTADARVVVARQVVETLEIEGGSLGRRVGDLLIIEPGRAADDVVGRRLAATVRRFPLDLDPPHGDTIEVRLELPPGWTPEEETPPFAIDTPELSARASAAIEGGRLVVRRQASVRVQEVAPERYPALRDAALRLRGADARAVVLIRGK